MITPPFAFSIRTAIRQSWDTVKRHLWFFIGMSLITVIFSLAGGDNTPWYLMLVIAIASFVWSMVWLRVSLIVVRNEETKLTFKSLRAMVPSLMDLLQIIGIGLLMGLFILCGLILLIIPGIYVMIRLSFAMLAYFDRKEGIMKSLRYSWDITKGEVVWTVLLTGFAILGIYLLGLVALLVGILVAYPVAIILKTKLYLALSARYNATLAVVEQPVEIPTNLPEAEVV